MMRSPRVFPSVLLALLPFTLAYNPSAAYGQAEFRAFWADAFNEGFYTAGHIDTIIARAVAGRYNAIIPEVLAYLDDTGGGHGAFWDTTLVPKSPSISPPGFDPLAYLCTQAHANNIEVHAWIYTYRACIAWPPTGNATLQAHPEWVMVPYAQAGSGPAPCGTRYFLDFGSPDVQDYYVAIVRELVTNYEIDGIHWDQEIPSVDCGYPSSLAYENSGLARYQRITGTTGVPLNNNTAWQAFRRRTVDELVRRAQAEIVAIKTNPRQPLRHTAAVGVSGDAPSACTFTSASSYTRYMDWPRWVQNGWLDAAIPMNYKREPCNNQGIWFRNWVNRINSCWRYDRHVYMGQAIYLNTFADSVVQANYTRSRSFEGIVTYSYANTRHDPDDPNGVCGTACLLDPSWYGYVANNLFTSVVATPDMPWRDPATAVEGTVWGRITAGVGGSPVDDATVDIVLPDDSCGDSPIRTVQSDGSGYYVLTMVPAVAAGTPYVLCVTADGYPTASVAAVCLAGDITRYDFTLGDGDSDGVPDAIDECPDTIGGAPVGPNGCALGDLDADGDVDLADFGLFAACFNGPNRSPAGACATDADLDADSDVDLADFGVFSQCFNGPNRAPAVGCP